MGVSPRQDGGITVRARLKIRTNAKNGSFLYVDVYGKKSCGEAMTLICQRQNIVYVEGELRNYKGVSEAKTYILVTYIECLYRRKSTKAPSRDIIRILDELDPIGYVPQINFGEVKKKKTRRNKNG